MDRMPNWERILQSDIWNEEIAPWLKDMADSAMEEMAQPNSTVLPATLEAFHYWRGYVNGLRTISAMPIEMHEADKQITAMENEDDGRRERAARSIERRRWRG